MNAKLQSKQDLAREYSDPDWLLKMRDLLSISGILAKCIIDDDYKVPVELSNAIVLSEAGRVTRQRLVTKESVKPNDASLMCLLDPLYVTPLIDVDKTDLVALADVVSASIRNGTIRFPLVYGRDLYDRATVLFKEEKRRLTHEETMKLLKDSPQGVFHYGHFLVGPYGLYSVAHSRRLIPSHAVPLQHCSDLTCPLVHRVRLETSTTASINRNRPSMHKVLEQAEGEPADWAGYLADLVKDEFNVYDIDDCSGVPAILGDALDDVELRSFLRFVAKRSDGRIQRTMRRFGVSGRVDASVETMSRSEVLQVLLSEGDVDLAKRLDEAVLGGDLQLQVGEVRRPMVNRGVSAGAWRLRPELSALGFRAVSSTPAVVWARMATLVRGLYDSNQPQEMDDLAWALRSVKGTTAKERLEHFLRTTSPRDVLRQLVLARRQNVEKAMRQLSILEREGDEELLNLLMWKLGFPLAPTEDVRIDYWRLHAELEAVTRTATVALDGAEEEIRGVASNYFVGLERYLFDALVYSTFALAYDHIKAERPFRFYASSARSYTIELLNEGLTGGEKRNELTEEPTLSQLLQGFFRLGKLLDRFADDPGKYDRPKTEDPEYVGKTNLQSFPFSSSVPYLDLTNSAQKLLASRLHEVGNALNDSGILTCRNGLLHATEDLPAVDDVNESLRRVRATLDRLEEVGGVRTTFVPVSSTSDDWGRTRTTMRSGDREISFFGPSGFEFVGVPAFTKPVYLMQGAVFSEPNEMLRFTLGFESPFERFWGKFPVRPVRAPSIAAEESAASADLPARREVMLD